MNANTDSLLVDAIAEAIHQYSSYWVIFDKHDGASIAEHLESIGWLVVFRDDADAEANGWVRRGP